MTLPKSSSKQEAELVYKVGFAETNGLHISEREHPDAEARFAMELLRQHGVLMGTPAGEDSAGRAKITYMPPDEVVRRAFDISELFHAEARRRGLMIQLPTQEEIDEKLEAKRADLDELKRQRLHREKVKSDA